MFVVFETGVFVGVSGDVGGGVIGEEGGSRGRKGW